MPENTTENSIPWKTIAASPDMMDVTFNNRRFPYTWRSSLAIAVYEPPMSDIPQKPCGQRIAFVKITCSLTGYQAAGSEPETITFGNEPLEELARLTAEDYLGCYGALLNVAVFPSSGPVRVVGEIPDLSVYPHILDFTPKNRELIRSITETGELLTGSTRNIEIDQSLTTTTKNETSVGVEAGFEKAGVKATGKISHTWGTTEEDKQGLKTGSGDSQTNKQAHSTSMDQLYSLLTGYHSGTNRATFIMLARPGTLQATNRRTFAGLRMLEGVQDFILVVARPEEQDDLCIEASLNTGHFHEDVELVGEEEFERKIIPFPMDPVVRGGSGSFEGGDQLDFSDPEKFKFSIEAGWELDTSHEGGAPASQTLPVGINPSTSRPYTVDRAPARIILRPGITMESNRTQASVSVDDNKIADAFDITVEPTLDGRYVQITGLIDAHGGNSDRGPINVNVDISFNIHLRRPKTSLVSSTADPAQLLVTSRGLSVCYQTVDGCPQVVDPSEIPDFNPTLLDPNIEWSERPVPLRGLSTREGTYSAIRSSLISSAVADSRGGSKRAFVDTDYFSQKVASSIPANIASVPVVEAAGNQVCGVPVKLLGTTTVRQLLSANLRRYVHGLGLKESEALELRRTVLSYVEARLKGE